MPTAHHRKLQKRDRMLKRKLQKNHNYHSRCLAESAGVFEMGKKSWWGGLVLFGFNKRGAGWIPIILGVFLVTIAVFTLHRSLNSTPNEPEKCDQPAPPYGYADYDVKSLSARIADVSARVTALQEKLEGTVKRMDKDKELREQKLSGTEFRRFVEEEVIQPLYRTNVILRMIRVPNHKNTSQAAEDPLTNFFAVEEIRKYIGTKNHKSGKINIHGVAMNNTHNSIGHACVLSKAELEEYMDYEIGSYCNDDWLLGQKLMLKGCDPLPRRRCLARASRVYQTPYPINESMWRVPDYRNVRWSKYKCRNFTCLLDSNPNKGFSKCRNCFDLEKEKLKWVTNTSLPEDFLIPDVLAVAGESIRIGLDVSVGTGTFAARMREWNVTVISTAMNIGAPFSEMISLRGLVPLYVSLNQRLPFFDNTMDLIHTTAFFDGWVQLQVLDFVLFDWDRVLRPGGLLWVDKFFCQRKDLNDYVFLFLQFKYKKLKWVVSQKSEDEVYLSALLEKPPRSL